MQSTGYQRVSPPSVLPGPGSAAAQQQPHVSISFTGTFGCAKPSNKRQRHNFSQNHSVISKNEAGRGKGDHMICKEQNNFIFPQQSSVLHSPSTLSSLGFSTPWMAAIYFSLTYNRSIIISGKKLVTSGVLRSPCAYK